MVDVDPHVAALKALVETSGRPVYVGRAPRDALNGIGASGNQGYIVLEPGQGLASTTSFDGSSDQRFCRFATRYFGSGWEQVDQLRTLAKAAVLDVRPAVAGRIAERIGHETEFPLDRAESMPDAVMFSGDSWTFATWPA